MRIESSANKCKFANLRAGDAFYYYDTLFMKTTCGLASYEPFNAVNLRDGRNTWVGKDTKVVVAKVHIESDKE